MKKRGIGFVATMLVCMSAPSAGAQVFTPTYMSPQRIGDTGIYISSGPGDFAVEGVWRRDLGGYDLGFRGAVADRSSAVLLLGAELRAPLDVDAAPVIMAITAGLQGAIGDGGAAGFQGGVTIGVPITETPFTIVPYLHPRLALVNTFGPRDDLDLKLLADIGFDFVLRQNLTFRVGFGLGDPTAGWGMGFAWR